ncbi:hypothetical protein KAT24_01535 [Candidatus Pacearchaeota archaeon]|nr:hypothetical protein [Candidatus Pacearchaeota archaeon]
MIKNKKGLSAIITTMLVVLLVLVAVGIVWAVVSGLLRSGAEDVELSAKCLNVDIRATAVNCVDGTANYECDVTFERTGTNTDAIGGVKLVFRNETAGINSGVLDVLGNIEALAGKKELAIDTTLPITGPASDKVEVTSYFIDASGNEKLCDAQTNTFSF